MKCLILAVLSMTAMAQTPTFEVASIRPAKPIMQALTDGSFIGMAIDPDRMRIGETPLSTLIMTAYKVERYQLSGPDWVVDPRAPADLIAFDIDAKLPAGATADQVPLMLQALLADRFKLTIRRGGKEIDTYALVTGKDGPKFKRKEPAGEPDNPFTAASRVVSGTAGKNGAATVSSGTYKLIMVPGVSMRVETSTIAGLVDYISSTGRVHAPIIDKTGLKGDFDIKIEMVPASTQPGEPLDLNALTDENRSRLLAAVEKLGLKLESQKNTVETIIVEHVERTPTEN